MSAPTPPEPDALSRQLAEHDTWLSAERGLAGNTLLTAAVGIVLIAVSVKGEQALLVPFGIGTGIVAYAIAVLVFTLLALWRGRRRKF